MTEVRVIARSVARKGKTRSTQGAIAGHVNSYACRPLAIF